MALDKELELFNKINTELQGENPGGGFVVIKGNEVLGVWNDRMDALKEGIDKYGNIEFLVKNIFDSDVSINFSRDLIFS